MRVMRRFAVAVTAAALTLVPTACSGGQPAPGPAASTATAAQPATPSPQPPLTAELTGDCDDPEGFKLKSSNFTPNGTYQTTATYQDGTPYTYLLNGGVGRVDANGGTPDWTWNWRDGQYGERDPNQDYLITLTDTTPGAPGNGRKVKLTLHLNC